jgi:hypothetical protein
MLKKTTAIVALAGLVATSAFAQEAAKKPVLKKKQAAAQAKKISTTKKNKKKKNAAGAVAPAAIIAPTSDAGSASPAQASATEVKTATGGRFLDRLSVSYQNVFYGPAISDPLSAYQPNEFGDVKGGGALRMKHYLGFGVKVSEKVKLTPTLYVNTYASGIDRSEGKGGTGTSNVLLGDAYIKATHSDIGLKAGKYSLSTDARLGLPTSLRSQEFNKLGYLRATVVHGYEITPKLSAGLATLGVWHVYGNYDNSIRGKKANLAAKADPTSIFSAAAMNPRFEVYAGPSLEYAVSEKFKVGLLYEMSAVQTTKMDLTDFVRDGTDLEPYISWDITPNLNFNPFLDFKTGAKVSADTTSLGAIITWKLL